MHAPKGILNIWRENPITVGRRVQNACAQRDFKCLAGKTENCRGINALVRMRRPGHVLGRTRSWVDTSPSLWETSPSLGDAVAVLLGENLGACVIVY